MSWLHRATRSPNVTQVGTDVLTYTVIITYACCESSTVLIIMHACVVRMHVIRPLYYLGIYACLFWVQLLEAHARELAWLEQRALAFRAKLAAAQQAEWEARERRLAPVAEERRTVSVAAGGAVVVLTGKNGGGADEAAVIIGGSQRQAAGQEDHQAAADGGLGKLLGRGGDEGGAGTVKRLLPAARRPRATPTM